jgi:hypothetical protein
MLIACTVHLTKGEQLGRRMLAGELNKVFYGLLAGTFGFTIGGRGGTAVQLAAAAACASIAWVLTGVLGLSGQKRLQGHSSIERTVTYRFYGDGFDVTTGNMVDRVEWAAIHRFIDGPRAFVLYAPHRVAHFIPKRELASGDIEALASLFKSRITPRRPPVSRALVGAVVVLFLLMALSIWQYLQSQR